jgi:curli production assembly/transport component CsgE
MIRLLLMFALGTQLVPATAADTGGAAQSITDSALNLTSGQFAGVVTNQAMTVAGQDFYQYFSALWYDKPLAEQFSLAVRERPSARQGNQVQVEFAGRTVFEALLPAARGNVRALSEYAVEVAYEAVSAAAAQRLLFREPDLAADEF